MPKEPDDVTSGKSGILIGRNRTAPGEARHVPLAPARGYQYNPPARGYTTHQHEDIQPTHSWDT